MEWLTVNESQSDMGDSVPINEHKFNAQKEIRNKTETTHFTADLRKKSIAES